MHATNSLIHALALSGIPLAILLSSGCGKQPPPVEEFSEVHVTVPVEPTTPAPHPHGGASLPDGHPPMSPQLPDGHPQVSQQLPDGHPPIGDMQGGMGGMQMPPGMTMTPPKTSLEWATPEGWQEQPGSGMRQASFSVSTPEGQAEGSIVVLTGAAGGVEPNINRWIGQIGQPLLSDDDMVAFVKEQAPITTAGGASGLLVDLTGLGADAGPAAPSMMVGLIQRDTQTVFIKLTGPRNVLQGQRDNLMALSQSLK